MGQVAIRAVFDAPRAVIGETAAALITARIQGAIAKQTVKRLWRRQRVAGEICTRPIAEKTMAMGHLYRFILVHCNLPPIDDITSSIAPGSL